MHVGPSGFGPCCRLISLRCLPAGAVGEVGAGANMKLVVNMVRELLT